MQTKPSIVFCNGIRADRSGFSTVIPPLRQEEHEEIVAQYGLATSKGDVESERVGTKAFAFEIKRSEWTLTTKENGHEAAY